MHLKSKIFRCFAFSSFLILATTVQRSYALEATFTPAPDKDTGSTDGPLPLSQNHRNQLLELDQQIAQSPNPQETLQKVAESNGMSTQELGDLLMRNRRDMQMAEGGGGGRGGGGGGLANSLPRKVIRLLSTIILLIWKAACTNPRQSTVMGILLISMFYVLISAPRNGIVISSKNGIFSSGHTTLLPPPTAYLNKYVNRVSRVSSLPKNIKTGSLSQLFSDDDIDRNDKKEGVQVVQLSKKDKQKFTMIINAWKEIPYGVLLPTEEELELMHENEKDNGQEDAFAKIENEAWDHAIDLAFESACRIISKRRYSEYVASPSNRLRVYSEQKRNESHRDIATLVMKSMGNFRRYGIQPLRVSSEYEDDTYKSVVYYTLKGGQFDGEIKFQVTRRGDGNDSEEEPGVVVSATLLIPKKGRKIKSKTASKMLTLLTQSIVTSSITEAKQVLSRELQSTIYRGRASLRATEKRHIAFENMKKMEEMAEERRRRWQRSNANAGSYRPSGHMMRSPGGGPSRMF